MGVPLVDVAVKYVVDFTLKTVLSDPPRYVKEVFGDARIDPLSALMGDRFFKQVEQWIKTTRLPCVLGFDLDPAQIPGVTIHLKSATPMQPFIGDAGFVLSHPVQPYNRVVVVPKFSPEDIIPSPDGQFITFIPPANLPPDQADIILPGLNVRDKNMREYGIGMGSDLNPTAFQISAKDPLVQADLSEIEVISPFSDTLFREGVMYYDDTVVVACHGHADRSEGVWLWAIVQWGLLKFRPLLTSTFGLDLAMPSASDFSKDDSFLGENVWTRYVNLSTKSVWSWVGPQSTDLLAFISHIQATNVDDVPPVLLPPESP
jgi:hypothetical protein